MITPTTDNQEDDKMSTFGWSYPAGAENDPNAPYNQDCGFSEGYDEPFRHWLRNNEWNTGNCSDFIFTESGKDADLEPGGCSGVTDIEWLEDEVVVTVSGHATFGWGWAEDDEIESIIELFCSTPYNGDGSDNEIYLTWGDTLHVDLPESDDWLTEIEPMFLAAVRQCIENNTYELIELSKTLDLAYDSRARERMGS